MEQFLAITGRNIKLYLRDRGAVFFSLLSTFITICLMLFFLGDMNIESVTGLLEEFRGESLANDANNARLLVLTWTSAGIVSINAVSVALVSYARLISDRERGKLNSLYTAPVSRLTIAAGYIAAAWLSSMLICVETLAITEIYGVIKGMAPYSLLTHLQLLGLLMINSFIYAAILYPMTMLAKTEGAWGSITTIICTLLGFLGGIYLPIGTLSHMIARIMKCTPVIYSTAMLRSVMCKTALNNTFSGLPDEVILQYREVMGIDLKLFGRLLTVQGEWLLLLACGIIFLGLGTLLASRKGGGNENYN